MASAIYLPLAPFLVACNMSCNGTWWEVGSALQLRQNGQQQGEGSGVEDAQLWAGMAIAKSSFPWSMHVSMALVTAAAFLFFEERDSSALIRKLVWSIIIPVRSLLASLPKRHCPPFL